jgi:beta-galactosidase
MAARTDQALLNAFYGRLIQNLALRSALPSAPPAGVSVSQRQRGHRTWTFIMNFTEDSKRVAIGGAPAVDLLTGEKPTGDLVLEPFGVAVLEREAGQEPSPLA